MKIKKTKKIAIIDTYITLRGVAVPVTVNKSLGKFKIT